MTDRIITTHDGFTMGLLLYGDGETSVKVTVCDTCGAVVMKLDHHRDHCPAPKERR